MKKLPSSFYTRNDVVQLAREMIGMTLHTRMDGVHTAGRIVETEAYNGIVDRASHAFGNRRTKRTEVMYAMGGIAYVYLCYGIHHLFNVVTNVEGIPHAVLIRAVEPVVGINTMLERRKKSTLDFAITKGPGSVSQSLGIFTDHSGISLLGDTIWLSNEGDECDTNDIIASPRIGVDYAQEDALLPYRFYLGSSPYVSGKKGKSAG
jgi:DNA-3-methyladenine glycosylase